MAKSRSRSRSRSSSRSAVLLILCLLSLFALSASMSSLGSGAARIGALCLPYGLYAAGAWYAYKDGARGARIGAVLLGILLIGGGGVGLVKGLRLAKGNAEINREFANLKAELARDASPGESGADVARRDAKLLEDAAARLVESDSPNAAAIGRVLQRIGELRAPVEERLSAAVEAVSSDEFLDIAAMLSERNFAQQREISEEYKQAARAANEFFHRLPKLLELELARSGLSLEAQAGMRDGVELSRGPTIRVCEGHSRLASEYTQLIEFLSGKEIDAAFDEEGNLTFATAEHTESFTACWQRITEAEEQLNAAITALQATTVR